MERKTQWGKKILPHQKLSAMGEEIPLLDEHGGNAPNQNTEDTLKPNRSDYIAPLPWFIYKYKVKPNTEENVSFTLKE